VHGLLGDIDGVVAELLEIQGDPEDAPQAEAPRAVRRLAGHELEAPLLQECEPVVDLVVAAFSAAPTCFGKKAVMAPMSCDWIRGSIMARSWPASSSSRRDTA
jgi:hypothetical protein